MEYHLPVHTLSILRIFQINKPPFIIVFSGTRGENIYIIQQHMLQRAAVISQIRPRKVLPLTSSLSLLVSDWPSAPVTHPKPGGWEHISCATAGFRQTQSLSSLTGAIQTDTKPIYPRQHPWVNTVFNMCKGLAALPTCCLERYTSINALDYSAVLFYAFVMREIPEATMCKQQMSL